MTSEEVKKEEIEPNISPTEKKEGDEKNKRSEEKKNRLKGFFGSMRNAAKSNPDAHRANTFFILAVLIHVLDGFLNFEVVPYRFAAYGFLFAYGWIFIFKQKSNDVLSKESMSSAFVSFGLAFLAFIVPIFAFKWLDPIMDYNLINVLVVCFPVYAFYFIIRPMTPLMQNIQKWIILFWIVIFVFYFFVAIRFSNDDSVQFLRGVTEKFMLSGSEADAGGAWGDLWRFVSGSVANFFSEFWKTITQAGNRTVAFGESRLEYATGGYYSGDEENAPEQGVFIKEIEQSMPEYIENTSVEIAAMIDIKTPSDYIDLEVLCEAEKDGLGEETLVRGEILEGSLMRGYKDEMLPVTCSFADGIKRGSYNILFKALYDYKTSSSLKVYFMDKERRDAMRAENLDPIEEYGKEKNPQSISTSGPVKLGIKQPALPIALDSGNDNGPLIGFTLDNDWGGDINEVKSIYVYTPEGMILDISYCKQFIYSGLENNMNVYMLQNPAEIGAIEEYLTINCKTKIEDKDKLLGQDELSTKQIKVVAEYVFKTEKSFSLRVE